MPRRLTVRSPLPQREHRSRVFIEHPLCAPITQTTQGSVKERKLVRRKVTIIGSPESQASSALNGKGIYEEQSSSHEYLHLLDQCVLRFGDKCASQWQSMEGREVGNCSLSELAYLLVIPTFSHFS